VRCAGGAARACAGAGVELFWLIAELDRLGVRLRAEGVWAGAGRQGLRVGGGFGFVGPPCDGLGAGRRGGEFVDRAFDAFHGGGYAEVGWVPKR
jgi:hypothetical protein